MKKILLSIFCLLGVVAVQAQSYVKVTSAPADWSGEYLIVYEAGNLAFNGGLATLDVVSNTISVTITNGEIAAGDATNAAKFTINASGHIKSASGYYIGRTSDSNGLQSNASTTYTNTLSLNANGTVNIVGCGGAYLRYNATSGQTRFRYYKSTSYGNQKAICLYRYEAAGGGEQEETVAATPVISPAAGEITADTEISITCATDGATIYYTTDGTAPTAASTEYTAPFTLDAAATVKAIAVKDGLTDSSVATATYTFPVVCENIAAFIAEANTSTDITISGEVVVVAQHGNYLFVQDETDKMIVYGSLGKTYNAGDRLTGIKGKYKNYNGLDELIPVTNSFGDAVAGEVVEPAEITLADFEDTELLTYVKVSNVEIPAGSGSSYTITDASGSVKMYNTLGIDVPEGTATVLGFVSVYSGTPQLMPIEITLNGLAAPVLSGEKTFEESVEVAISAEDGATIYYTLDGTDPTTASTVYSGPFTVAETTTVKAIAVKGGETSAVAEAQYTKIVAGTVSAAIINHENGVTGTTTVTGYIVGIMKGTNNGDFTNETTTASNIIIADDADETDVTKCIPVELKSGTTIRSVLNLADNSANYKRKITITGSLEAYFSVAGIKSLDSAGLHWSVGEEGYATLFLGYKVEIPSTVKAYIVSATNATHTIMTQVDGIVPAETGLILEGEGEHLFNITTATPTAKVGGNMLSGSATDYEFAAAEGTTYYVLANPAEGKGVGFYKFDTESNEGNFFNAANKAYLAVTGASPVASYSFQFPGTTGIEGVEAENGAVKGIYDLTGRRIDAITAPGIYIIDGVKTIVK